ncbi:MAG TPA: SpoIID/LytB domain-containing protein [Chitinispirillaceae bacterium]|nr:SpoIID/LytB domain-containing protein [Chitinispirillaceae bacterium]
MINLRINNFISIAVFCCFLYRCTPNLRYIKVNPPDSSTVSVTDLQAEAVDTISAESKSVDSSLIPAEAAPDDIDFSVVLDSATDTSSAVNVITVDTSSPLFRYPPCKVLNKKVRIALERNVSVASFFAEGKIKLRSAAVAVDFNGKIITRSSREGKVAVFSSRGNGEILLPCTLISAGPDNLIKVDQLSYRGEIILISEKSGSFSIVNYIDVEQYLRGVVPLEIGKRPENLIEALKAQAIAARTYTYKRMMERRRASFDMTATIQDQVYGGADSEYRESNMAVNMTEDMIMVCEDSLIHAYYHSTCGGRTANIEDVWDKPYCSYLRSMSDLDSSGLPYCRISPRFNWQEQWSRRVFFDQIYNNLQKMYPGKDFQGNLKGLVIKEVFACGRIKDCTFSGQRWLIDIGGDKLRFVIRRDTPERSILRSANFKIISLGPKDVLISGTGYGHGIGMCQMGAIGRAGAGQSFEQILQAYYTGVRICKATKHN